MTWTCARLSDVYAAATVIVDQGLSLDSLCAAISLKGPLNTSGKRKQETTPRPFNPATTPFNKGIKSIYYVLYFTDDMYEVGAKLVRKVVI